MSGRVILEARGLVKRFDGFVALDGVSFDLREGEVHALCGENGAGKSTLIKLLAGVHGRGSYEGEILVDGLVVGFRGTRDAERAGVAIIHQELALFSELTVGENLFLGQMPCRHGRIRWDRVHAQAASALEACGIQLDPSARVGDLGIGQRQLVEIARAVARRPRVLVLDEPTAALASHEVDTLLALVRRLRDRGVACVLVSHKLEEVFAVADRITVLRDGAAQGTVRTPDTDPDDVIRRMVGRRVEDYYPRRRSAPGDVLLAIRDLGVDGRDGGVQLRNLNLEVRAGEVLGIGGLMGAGRTELLMHLVGLWGRRRAGQVELRGQPFTARGPAHALRQGLALVSEDRRRFGLVPDQGVAFNISLSSLDRLCHWLLVDRNQEAARSREIVDRLCIRVRDVEQLAGTLSGGNQQKVVLGKALLTEPSVLLLDEPTRGIDVGARLEVYELVNRLTEDGKAIVLVSSDLGELMGMSDRIVMLCAGRVGGAFEGAAATQEALLAAAMGRHQRAA